TSAETHSDQSGSRSSTLRYLLLPSLSPPPPTSTLFPYTTLFRSRREVDPDEDLRFALRCWPGVLTLDEPKAIKNVGFDATLVARSEEHTSELQSLAYLVCRLLLEKKKTNCTNCIRFSVLAGSPCP